MDSCARCKPITLPRDPLVGDPLLRRRSRPLSTLASLTPFRLSSNSQGLFRMRRIRSFGAKRVPAIFVMASGDSNECDWRSVGTPLEPQSPEGKFLCGILKNHPHIFRAAAAEQLKELALERESAFARWEHSVGSSESSLHGRIAQMKEQECQIAAEDVMYMLIVHNFSEIKVPMVPNLSKCTNNGRLEIWSSKDRELESIHGPEVLEMVREHLTNILKWRGKSDIVASWSTMKIKRLQLGRLYAASILYGYFLKSVSLRHHLELSLALSHDDLSLDKMIQFPLPKVHKHEPEENLVPLGCSSDMTFSFCPSKIRGGKTKRLRGYMMGFDSKTLQLCAKLRSSEAANLIEKHSWALFRDQESESLVKDELIDVSFSGLKRLVLEAVAFGSFLWDVEGYVDSVYRLKES
ncbi:hypothetical protein J5N97_019840 [Dioscorea zingiberensis]|uniref:UV-B-induced protein At3g17800, chloroplastic n=1 Tax=Dioscorea zingiberensis TaxID=325984 RepID=A0A9D5HCN8_9LILI|nr:hypothetical protein J5N97_019840 [Dioscorea zingiberensis]